MERQFKVVRMSGTGGIFPSIVETAEQLANVNAEIVDAVCVTEDEVIEAARDADIISVQVFSEFTGETCSDFELSSPCALAWTSDQIAALDWIYSIHSDHNIAAVNMSLGGGYSSNYCDADARKNSIDNLRSVHIATIVSAGNDGYRDALSAPACISSAISVGNSTESDLVHASSNVSSFLSLLAPGVSIDSSTVGNGYGSVSGTSMAAAHVSGAWALLRSQAPTASVAHILYVLQTTAVPINDERIAGVLTDLPRIRVEPALALFKVVTMDVFETQAAEAEILATAEAESSVFSSILDETAPIFKDVLYGHWAFDYINALYNVDSITACSSDPWLYCPDADFTYAQSVAFVRHGKSISVYESPSMAPATSAVDDAVSGFLDTIWTEDSLLDDGFQEGCQQPHPTDCASRTITRAEGSALFLSVMQGAEYIPPLASGIFADVDPASPYAGWIEAAYYEGIMPACNSDPLEFCPEDAITRDWAAYMMVQAMGGLPLPQETSFSFAIASDMRAYAGSGKYNTLSYFRGAAEAIAELGTTDFLILPGDMDHPSYAHWTIETYIGSEYQWYPVVGNHDIAWEHLSWIMAHDKGVVTPGPSGCPDTTYSFDIENAHFVILNVYCNHVGPRSTDGDISDHLYNWLAADLEATDQTHVFVFGHEPAFPRPDVETGSLRHEGDSLDAYPERRDRFWRLLDDYYVVFYGCGHTHGFNLSQLNRVWQLEVGHSAGLGYSNAPSTFTIITVFLDYIRYEVYRDEGDGGAYYLYQRGKLY